MTVKKVEGHIDAIERKLVKSIKIAEKGPNMKLADVAKLGRKTNSIVSEINKSIKEYDVSSFSLPFLSSLYCRCCCCSKLETYSDPFGGRAGGATT